MGFSSRVFRLRNYLRTPAVGTATFPKRSGTRGWPNAKATTTEESPDDLARDELWEAVEAILDEQ